MLSYILTIVGLLISFSSLTIVFIFNLKGNKREDVSEIERRAAHTAETNYKLDEINRNVSDIKSETCSMRKEVQFVNQELAILKESFKSEHKRLDRLENIFDTLRERMGVSDEG